MPWLGGIWGVSIAKTPLIFPLHANSQRATYGKQSEGKSLSGKVEFTTNKNQNQEAKMKSSINLAAGKESAFLLEDWGKDMEKKLGVDLDMTFSKALVFGWSLG